MSRISAINEYTLDNDIAWFASQWIGELKQRGNENDKEHLEDRMAGDNWVFAEAFRPEEICFAENAAEESSCQTEENEGNIMDGIVIDAVFGFEEHEFSSPCGIQGFKDDRRSKGTKK